MNARILALLVAAFPLAALGQGFAGLGTDAEGFAVPQRGVKFEFPKDHGPHPAYRIEWWYVTANLASDDGTPYGIQWTLFRTALEPEERAGWDSPQLWMGHAALTSTDNHFVAERLARGGIGQAGVNSEPFEAWIDEWTMRGATPNDIKLVAQSSDFSYNLNLETDKPFVPQGDAGYSIKSPDGQASYYYSQPFYEVEGTLSLPSGEVEVTGSAWLDREWSSQPLSESQTGWDWFSIGFDDGSKMMGFVLRDRAGDDYSAATWITPEGDPTPYPDGAFRAEPLSWHTVEGREVPTRWRLLLADREIDVKVQALNPNAWMSTSFPYWEGPVRVSGSHTGQGYLEMTGYE